jgi:hypothetical protein
LNFGEPESAPILLATLFWRGENGEVYVIHPARSELKLRLPVSGLRENCWNLFTWLLFLGLIFAFGWLSELIFGAWSWAWDFARMTVSVARDLPEIDAHVRIGRYGTAKFPVFITAMLWIAYLVPLTLTMFPAVGTIFLLAQWKEHSTAKRPKKRRYLTRWPIS